jgi:thiol-disulfide isomerase/thioredoxin
MPLMPLMARRLVPLAVLVTGLVAVLTGCSGLPESGDKGYPTGKGLVTELAADERDAPVEMEAQDLEGQPVDLAGYRGKPLVVVVWWSGCVECRVEQDQVNQAVTELEGTAEFIGLDIREPSVANGLAYQREQKVPYASIDAIDGKALQSFSGTLTPYTVPAFVVLDADGRIAANIIGQLPSKLTLVEVVEEVASGATGDADG